MKILRLLLFFFPLATFSCKDIEAVVEDDSFIINDALPAYYTKHYLSDRCKSINSFLVNNDGDVDSFVFITDMHFEKNSCHSGILINTILKNTPIKIIIYGGDTGSEQSADDKPIGLSLLAANIEKFKSSLIDVIQDASFFAVRGNHDLSCKIDETTFDGFPIQFVIDLYLSFMPTVYYDKTEGDGLYYFFDNGETKVRYIAIDTSYGRKLGAANLGYRQLKWILDEAIGSIPEDYSLVFLTHIPISLGVDITTEYSRFKPLKEIITAINNNRKGSVSCDGQELEYNFTSNTNKVLFVLSGHIHSDAQAYEDNVLYIATTCDRVSNDMVSQYEEEYRQTRKIGDITEQAFDVVSYNNSSDGWIMMTRFGAGYSRFYNKRVIALQKGDTISLLDNLSFVNPIKWDANDAPGAIGSWSCRNWTRSLTVLEINHGKITALKEGEAMVFAEDQEHNKEFFLVKVTSSI